MTVAPNVGFALGGRINYFNNIDMYETTLSESNFSSVDFGLFFGVGTQVELDINTWKLYVGVEAGYNLGFLNTFSVMEQSGNANIINGIFVDVNGTRKNNGAEMSFSVGFPLSNFSNHKPKPKPIAEPEPIVVAEPVVEPEPVKDTTEKVITMKAKECYTLREMMAFITLNMDISDKAICMFDLKFDFAKATIRNESKKTLDEVVEMLNQFPEMIIQINGHTDNVGSEEYNTKLSTERAKAVYDYFVKSGVSSDRMSYTGRAFHLPIDSNDTEEGRARNRRVEIEILQIKK